LSFLDIFVICIGFSFGVKFVFEKNFEIFRNCGSRL